MPGRSRMIKINDEVMKEVSNIIRGELKDPRISSMTSVVKTDVTNDLKYCKIFVSVLGDDKQKADVMEGLKNAQGYIRKRVAERVNLRNTPELKFILDESLEYGMRISKLITDIVASEEANSNEANSNEANSNESGGIKADAREADRL